MNNKRMMLKSEVTTIYAVIADCRQVVKVEDPFNVEVTFGCITCFFWS